MTDKTCQYCNAVMAKPPAVGKKGWANRRFCNKECEAAHRRLERSTTCARCGGFFLAPSGRGQSSRNPQRFCSHACSVKGRPTRRYRKRGETLEHRAVMEEMLGRPLMPFETVHHKNGMKTENSPGNLELWCIPQPAGQRVEDLVEWVVSAYPERVREIMDAR